MHDTKSYEGLEVKIHMLISALRGTVTANFARRPFQYQKKKAMSAK